MKIARLKNGNIVKIRNIPGKYIRPEDAEKGQGWYPVKELNMDKLGELQALERIDVVYNAENDVVREKPTVKNISLNEYKQSKFNELKEQVKSDIYSEYSVEDQLSALMGNYSQKENDDIKLFVKDKVSVLRGIKQQIKDATDKAGVDNAFNSYGV